LLDEQPVDLTGTLVFEEDDSTRLSVVFQPTAATQGDNALRGTLTLIHDDLNHPAGALDDPDDPTYREVTIIHDGRSVEPEDERHFELAPDVAMVSFGATRAGERSASRELVIYNHAEVGPPGDTAEQRAERELRVTLAQLDASFEVWINGALWNTVPPVDPDDVRELVIGPGESRVLEMVFAPVQEGRALAPLVLGQNDGDVASEWVVQLFGVGLNPGRKRYYYVSDHLGSVRATVNEGGEVVSRDDYYPFGLQQEGRSVVGHTRTQENYTGHQLDTETGLLYAGARYYDPLVARWSSVDPLAATSPNLTPYHYVRNNPLTFIDPDGMKEVDCSSQGITSDSLSFAGDWCISDRENNTDRWNSANLYNLENGLSGEYNSITQRAGFYGWFADLILSQGYETYWPGAASVVANQMAALDNGFVADFFGEDIVSFGNLGNEAIFNDVFGKLGELYSGPALTGDAAVAWDSETLRREQFIIVEALYGSQSSETLATLEQMAKGQGIYMFGVSPSLRFSGSINSAQDRYNHGMTKVTSYYKRQRQIRAAYKNVGYGWR